MEHLSEIQSSNNIFRTIPGQTIEQTPTVANNRLEALKVLTNSILREIESLRQGTDVTTLDKVNLADEVQRFEVDLIRCALVRTGGKQRQAAKLLNVKITTLNAKIKRYGISPNGLSETAA